MGNRRIRLLAAGATLSLVLAACANSDEPDGSENGEAGQTAPATVTVEDSEFGQIVVDGEGRTLYVFLADDGGESTCYDDCEANWPPLSVVGEPTGDNVDASLLGTAEREDGSTQVTLDGRPLYYFAADENPDDFNGQGVGDVWFVVSPEGEPIMAQAQSGDAGYMR